MRPGTSRGRAGPRTPGTHEDPAWPPTVWPVPAGMTPSCGHVESFASPGFGHGSTAATSEGPSRASAHVGVTILERRDQRFRRAIVSHGG